MMKITVMTVDIDPSPPSCPYSKAEDGLDLLLELFKKYMVKATFFVTAELTRELKHHLNRILDEKHEIACHGLKHDPKEINLSLKKQIRRIALATRLIENTTGVKPIGFRAPNFKVNNRCLAALQKNGYLYDSSMICSFLYGYNRIFPISKPFILASYEKHAEKPLIEIPVSVNPFWPFPLGGAYLRIFGPKWLKIGAKMTLSFKAPVVLYIHPKDLCGKMRSYYFYTRINVDRCEYFFADILRFLKEHEVVFIRAQELAESFFKKEEAT
jgi:peptidoglycan/xylan/chitin deacetylase (PgdA/CDA1 family)